jgi:hypothetical protein
MIDLGSVISFSIFIVVFFLFIWRFFSPLISQSLKASKIDEFKDGFYFKAGGCFDDINLSFPFVEIKLEEFFIRIKYSGFNCNIMYNQIRVVDFYRGLISNGVLLNYSNDSVLKKIIIWTPFYNQLIKYIQSKLQNSEKWTQRC